LPVTTEPSGCPFFRRSGIPGRSVFQAFVADTPKGFCSLSVQFRFLDPTLSVSSFPMPGIECRSVGATRLLGFSPREHRTAIHSPPGSDLLAKRTNLLSPSVSLLPVFKVTTLGASLSRAVCSPTPLSAACGCLGLMAGPFRPFPVGIFRVRPLRPVRPLPAGSSTPDVVQTRLQCLNSRVGTVATGTAPAFGRTLAPRYGSDLLTLRLLSLLQWGDPFFRAAPIEEVRQLCQADSLPAIAPPLRALSVRADGAFWWGGPTGTLRCVLVIQ
jgi:hypothetical protein